MFSFVLSLRCNIRNESVLVLVTHSPFISDDEYLYESEWEDDYGCRVGGRCIINALSNPLSTIIL